MPDPPPSSDSFAPQKGRKIHSWGKLLPGWEVAHDVNGNPIVTGPAAPDGGLPLPEKSSFDEDGFLLEYVKKGARLF
jgi:hypothetical protein